MVVTSLFALVAIVAVGASVSSEPRARLEWRAVLPAATFDDGPPSGLALARDKAHGQDVPFPNQPVQGVSSLVRVDDDEFLALLDNGYGSPENSYDFLLRVYRLRIDWRSPDGGVRVVDHINLSDPDGRVPFQLTDPDADGGSRVLTGADFDPESMVLAPDGTLWIGDELGPFLLHFDRGGRLIEPPIELPDPDEPAIKLRSPSHPTTATGAMLRLMLRARSHAERLGARAPVVSPDYHGLSFDWPAADPSRVDVPALRRAGFPVIPWTVNEPAVLERLLKHRVDGIITDYPNRLRDAVARHGPVESLDMQGHRGARGLRPENTLPAIELALDLGVSTLELDLALTADDRLLLSHDPQLDSRTVRRWDDTHREPAPLIKDLTLAEIQAYWVADQTRFGDEQSRDPKASPLSVEFTARHHLRDPYTPVDLDAVLDFVSYYGEHYEVGAGREHPDADSRSRVAATVRFNLETKVSPRSREAAAFVDALRRTLQSPALQARVDIQSFDFQPLLDVMERVPALRTSFLFSSPLKIQPFETGPLSWPGIDPAPIRVAPSGGLEGLALTPDGRRLVALMEKPLLDDSSDGERAALAFEFDLGERRFSGRTWRVPMSSGATAFGELRILQGGRWLLLERDDTQGDAARHKVVRSIDWSDDGDASVATRVDLLDIADPDGLAGSSTGQNQRFRFPFVTIESVVPLDSGRLMIVNDNNFPLSVGRHVADDRPDDTEFIVIATDPVDQR